jgi:LmeA-like phospholipid-binding
MRAARRLIIALVILAILFTAADRIAVSVAQSQVADKLQSSRNLNQKPGVDIEGFPFLTQVLGGSLDHVKVHIADLVLLNEGTQALTLDDFQADLRHVKLENNYTTAVAGSATGTALIPYTEVSDVLPNHLTVGYAGGDRVRVSATIPVLDKQVTGTAGLGVQGNGIGLTSVGDLTGLSGIPGVSSSSATAIVSQYVGTQFRVTGLPEGLELTGAQATPGGLLVSVAGTGVSLTSTSG